MSSRPIIERRSIGLKFTLSVLSSLTTNSTYKMSGINTNLPLKGVRALVTGGSQRIRTGIYVGLAISVSADIATEVVCCRAVEESIAGLGSLDILVNCAALGRNCNMLGKLADADWDMHQQIVLNAAVILADAETGYLVISGRRVIVNISSITGSLIMIDQCSWPYHGSKAGLDQLIRWLAVCLVILVNAVAHDISQAVIFLSSKQSAYLTGQVLTVNGGLGIDEVFGASLRAFKSCVEASI